MKLRELISWSSTVVAACCAIAVLTLPILGPDSAKKTGELAINLVAALGTLGAVIVSLHLARKSGEKDKEAQMLSAQITANKLHTQVTLLRTAVQTCTGHIELARQGENFMRALPNEIRSEISTSKISFDHEDLVRLGPLPDRCAERLAACGNLLEKLLVDINSGSGFVLLGLEADAPAVLDRWKGYLDWTEPQLKRVEAVLAKSSIEPPMA